MHDYYNVTITINGRTTTANKVRVDDVPTCVQELLRLAITPNKPFPDNVDVKMVKVEP